MDFHIDALSSGEIFPADSGLADFLKLPHFVGASSVYPVVVQVYTILKLVVEGILLLAPQNFGFATKAICVEKDELVAPWQHVRFHLFVNHALGPSVVLSVRK